LKDIKLLLLAFILVLGPNMLFASTTNPDKDYAGILGKFVDERGFVDYSALKLGRGPLDRYVDSIGKVAQSAYEAWGEKEKIAFWINAYNAITLQTILDHYPIRESGLFTDGKPGGIRDISGAWDGIKHIVLGKPMVLNQIEHEILRKQFHEPRIHFALVCASIGCPYLRQEPYDGKRLDRQLDDQVRRFLSNPTKFRIDAVSHKVYLSSIFKWFGSDFEAGYLAGSPFKGYSDKDSADLNFISRYLTAKERTLLLGEKFDVEYLDYDWSLNDQHQP
jgi:hypothetical protein